MFLFSCDSCLPEMTFILLKAIFWSCLPFPAATIMFHKFINSYSEFWHPRC